MNTTHKILILLSILCCSAVAGKGQNILDNKVYRVTAIKRGNNSVTSTSNHAEIIPPLNIYIPSAFSPNGDGLNDTFGIKGEGISDYHIYIYDRWGEVIFESANPKYQWDGKCNGHAAEQGVYVYQVFAMGIDSKGKTGHVTLVY